MPSIASSRTAFSRNESRVLSKLKLDKKIIPIEYVAQGDYHLRLGKQVCLRAKATPNGSRLFGLESLSRTVNQNNYLGVYLRG